MLSPPPHEPLWLSRRLRIASHAWLRMRLLPLNSPAARPPARPHLLLQAQRAREPRVPQHIGMVARRRCRAPPAAHDVLQLSPPLHQHLATEAGAARAAVSFLARQGRRLPAAHRRAAAAGQAHQEAGSPCQATLARCILPTPPAAQRTLACSAACRLSASVAPAAAAAAAAPSPPAAAPSSSSSSRYRATHSAAASKSSRASADWMPSTACRRSSTSEMWPSAACTRDCAVSSSRTCVRVWGVGRERAGFGGQAAGAAPGRQRRHGLG